MTFTGTAAPSRAGIFVWPQFHGCIYCMQFHKPDSAEGVHWPVDHAAGALTLRHGYLLY